MSTIKKINDMNDNDNDDDDDRDTDERWEFTGWCDPYDDFFDSDSDDDDNNNVFYNNYSIDKDS